MTSGDQNAKVGIFHRLFNLRGIQMCPYMVYPDERDIQSRSKSFCEIHTDEESSQEPRTVRHAHRIDIIKRNPGFLDGIANHTGNPFGMQSGGELGNDPLIGSMLFYLCRYLIA